MNVLSRWVVLILIMLSGAHAQWICPETIDWKKVRDVQPEGHSLNLDIPRTNLRMGDIIEATLTFRYASSNPYHLWGGTYDRSGRIRDIAIYATDAAGAPGSQAIPKRPNTQPPPCGISTLALRAPPSCRFSHPPPCHSPP